MRVDSTVGRTYTIADLSVENPSETIEDDLTLERALRRMFEREYTQMGVVRDGDIVGVITYRSVVRSLLALHRLDVETQRLDRVSISAVIEDVRTISADDPVLSLFEVLADDTYAPTERDGELHILTDHDLLVRLQEAIEPFSLIEAIEMSIRGTFERVFGDDLEAELASTFDESHPLPAPTSVQHCSFGHYAQFISMHWDVFEPVFGERQAVVRELVQAVGDLRDRLFHFRIEDPEEFEQDLLRFAHSFFTSV
jgi:CBS domain-containing protein